MLEKKYCRTKCPSEENVFDDEMCPFAVSIREGEKRYRLGQEFLLAQKICISSCALKKDAVVSETGRGNELEGDKMKNK